MVCAISLAPACAAIWTANLLIFTEVTFAGRSGTTMSTLKNSMMNSNSSYSVDVVLLECPPSTYTVLPSLGLRTAHQRVVCCCCRWYTPELLASSVSITSELQMQSCWTNSWLHELTIQWTGTYEIHVDEPMLNIIIVF